MASNRSKRRAGEEHDNVKSHKKIRLSQGDSSTAQFDIFGESYSTERNEDMFDLHNGIQLPTKIHGGHIRASVVDIIKYPNRKCVGLLLKLGPSKSDTGGPQLLECELMHPRALECQHPVHKDIIYVALTGAKLVYNDKDEQLCFKLRFESSLIYIVPFEREDANSGEPRILKLVDTGKPCKITLQTRKDAPENDHLGHVQTNSRPLAPAEIPAISHNTGRVRKRDTRHVNNKQGSSSGPVHKAARKPVKEAKKASLVTNTSPVVVVPAPSAPEDPHPPLDGIEIPAEDTARDLRPVSDVTGVSNVQRREESPITQQDNRTKRSSGGFVSSGGIQFLALGELDSLQDETPVNVVGIVESKGEIKLSQRNEFWQDFRLSDPTQPDFSARLFAKQKQWMPNVQVGQILLLHNATFTNFKGRPMVVGSAATFKWIGYDPKSRQTFFSEDGTGPKYQYLDHKAKDYFAALTSSRAEILNDPNRVVIAAPSGKQRLLSELTSERFFDATVEVLSVEHHAWGAEIFVTDYTRNDLFDDIQDRLWGLIGRKRALRISVWPQEKFSYKAACLVKTGKFYLLKNFIFKSTRFGWAAKVISQDNAEFRRLQKDSQDPDLRRLMERRAAFNRNEVDEDEEVSGMDGVYYGNPMDANRASSSVAEAKPVPVEEPLSGHKIICGLMSPFTNFKTIENDPHCHVEYKIRGRIVDITPSHPQEMIYLRCTNCQKSVTTNRKEPAICSVCKSTSSLELDIKLSLLVIDEADQSLSVIVSEDEAKHLFGISSVNLSGSALTLESIAEDVVTKLRNVAGKLWVHGPSFESFVNEGETLNGSNTEGLSPWIDLAIRSWHVKVGAASSVRSSRWVRRYNLIKCTFQVQ